MQGVKFGIGINNKRIKKLCTKPSCVLNIANTVTGRISEVHNDGKYVSGHY